MDIFLGQSEVLNKTGCTPVGTLAIYKDGQLVEAVNKDNEKIL